MRWLLLPLLLVTSLAAGPATEPATQPASRLIVHEWGTFTSFSGSDGIALEYRPLVDSKLPAFVVDRPAEARLLEVHRLEQSTERNYKSCVTGSQRMETPVLYFYSDAPRRVSVHVDFPHGLLTEFYPPVNEMTPKYTPGSADPLTGSSITWADVNILPRATSDSIMPQPIAVAAGEQYGEARATDSNLLHVIAPSPHPLCAEKFLFYRGVGNMYLPFTLKSEGAGKFTLDNAGPDEIPAAFLIDIADEQVRFAAYRHLAGSTAMQVPATDSTADALGQALIKALTEQSLFPREAAAMVNTWKASWFTEPGTRVLYLLPRPLTDRILPLTMTPAPDETVRVMVGRLETLTPEAEARVGVLITRLASPDGAIRDTAQRELHALGRFAEPTLNRIEALTKNPEVKQRVQQLLSDVQKAP